MCLDGISAGYYLRDNNASKWLLFFEGGAWCYDHGSCDGTVQGTLERCQHRATTDMGSSLAWAQTREYTGWLSADGTENPVFFDWNLVLLAYCDGTSFSSDATVNGLHFRGRAILHSIVRDLLDSTAIRDADTVVVAGESAGGTSVFYHGDTVAELLGLDHGRVLGLSDSGFLMDLPESSGEHCWANQMRLLFNMTNAVAGLHEGCLALYNATDAWKCIFPEHFAHMVTTPTFLMQAQYDAIELWFAMKLFQETSMVRRVRDLKRFQQLPHVHRRAWGPLVSRPGSGVWAPACVGHKLGQYKWTEADWAVPSGSGNTMAVAVQSWLDGLRSNFADVVEWPQNEGCAKPSHMPTFQ